MSIPSKPQPINAPRQAGLTLLELIWGVALLSIVVVAGIPSLSAMVKRYQAESDFRAFRNIISFARAEALVRRKSIILCPRKANSQQCYDTAIASDQDEESAWKNGWLLFVNYEGSDSVIDANDLLLKVHEELDQNLTLRMGGSTGGSGHLNYIRFNAKGNSFPTTPSALFCQLNGGDVNFAGQAVVSFGRVRLEERTVAEGLCNAL